MQMVIGLMKTGEYDGARLRLLTYLAWKHDWHSGFIWPSRPRIAEETGLDERTVKRAMRDLETRGVIRRAIGNGRGNLTKYEFPALSAPAIELEKKGGISAEKGGHSDTERGAMAREKGGADERAIREEKQIQKRDQNTAIFTDREISNPWTRLTEQLRITVNPHTFETWLWPLRFHSADAGVLVLRIPAIEFRHSAKFWPQIYSANCELGLGLQRMELLTDDEIEMREIAPMAQKAKAS